jgi:hypothetical protein
LPFPRPWAASTSGSVPCRCFPVYRLIFVRTSNSTPPPVERVVSAQPPACRYLCSSIPRLGSPPPLHRAVSSTRPVLYIECSLSNLSTTRLLQYGSLKPTATGRRQSSIASLLSWAFSLGRTKRKQIRVHHRSRR